MLDVVRECQAGEACPDAYDAQFPAGVYGLLEKWDPVWLLSGRHSWGRGVINWGMELGRKLDTSKVIGLRTRVKR